MENDDWIEEWKAHCATEWRRMRMLQGRVEGEEARWAQSEQWPTTRPGELDEDQEDV